MDLALLVVKQISVPQNLPVSPKEVGYLAVDQEITQIAAHAVVTAKLTAVASPKVVDLVATVGLQVALHVAKLTIAVEKE